jgi:PAS domain S-box-containing protein
VTGPQDESAELADEKLTTEALRSAVAHYTAIINSTSDAIVHKSLAGIVLGWSRGAETIFGYTSQEMLGQSIQRLLPDDRWAEEARVFEQVSQGLEFMRFDTVRIRKDRTTIHVSVSISPIRDNLGRIIGASTITRDITERVQFTAALIAREKEFYQLAEAMPQIVWATRADGWNTYFNQQWVAYTGMTLEESRGHGWKTAFHPDDGERAWAAWQNAVKQGGSYSLEARLRRADGSYRWWLVRAVPFFDEAGNIAKWYGTFTDIQQLKQAELDMEETQRTLAESESRFRGAFETAAHGMALVSIDGTWIKVNRSLCAMLGYTERELLLMRFQDITHPDDLESDLAQFRALLEGRIHSYEMEKRYLQKNGNIIWACLSVALVRSRSGSPIHFVSHVQDITERKQSEVRLHRFRRLTDSNVQSVFFWNMKGEITDSNEAFLRLVGYTREDLKAGILDWKSMTPPEFVAADQRALEQIAAHGICETYEKELFRKDGVRTPILIGAAIFEDNPHEGVCFALDLTERNKLEQQLRQSQKMELLGQLTGGIAHDFNNLLGVIELNLELIRERLAGDRESEDMVGMALHATERGANLTHQLLAFARQQPLQPRIVNIETLLTGMVSLLQRTLGENIKVSTILAANLWNTNIDPHQFENALLNLALNSLHAMPSGGALIIEASNEVVEDRQDLDAPPGEYVMVAVTDSGAGMSPEILARFPEPFFTTKPVGQGSGLGLSMVHGFVRQSGGCVKIHSEIDAGTTVKLFLPKAAAEADPETAADRSLVLARGIGQAVLLVEDNQDLRRLTRQILDGLGYRTLEAADGPSACAMLDSLGRIDLLLTDVVLPAGMSGPELARKIHVRWPALKVIYMSGHPRDALLLEGALGAKPPLLTKPFSKAELAQMVGSEMNE